MALHQVTDEMRSEAADYLLRRFDNEGSVANNITLFAEEAIDMLVAIVKRYGITSKQLIEDKIPSLARADVEAVVQWFIDSVAEACFVLAVDERTDNDWFVAFFAKPFVNGYTFADRMEQYGKRFGWQICLAIGALMYMGVKESMMREEIKSKMRDLYSAPWWIKMRDYYPNEFVDSGIGKGIPKSMVQAIENLARQMIGNAFSQYEYEDKKNSGAIGYYIERGSSYDCPECDSLTNKFYYISTPVPIPSHFNCKCLAVYVFE